jgi:hypothetical protein
MGIINVEGVGQVQIAGDTPTKEELEIIEKTYQKNISQTSKQTEPQTQTSQTEKPKPRGLEIIGGRPVFEMIGGFAGAVPGLAGGLPGSVAGGVLGASGGGQVYDILQGYILDEEKNLGTQTQALKNDLTREGFFQSIFAKVPGLGKTIKKVFVNPKDKGTKQLYNAAKNLKDKNGNPFPLSISDAGNIATKSYGRVVGVFPFVGTPIKKGVAAKANILNEQANNMLNDFAPNVHLTDLGIDMTNAAKATYQEWRSVTGKLYDDFYDTAAKIKSPVVPTLQFKKSLKAYTDLIEDGTIREVKSGVPLKTPTKDEIYNYAKQFEAMPDTINISQYRAITRDLKKFFRMSEKEGFDISVLSGFKKGLEKDLNALTNPEYLAKFGKEAGDLSVVRDKLLFANKVYSEGITNNLVKEFTGKALSEPQKAALKTPIPGKKAFQKPVAKTFERVDKNIFSTGYEKPGSITPDDLANKLINSRTFTPNNLDDLKTLIGDESFNKFTRSYFEKAFGRSLVKSTEKGVNGLIFDPFEFKNALGLNNENGRAIVKKLIKDSNLSMDKIDDFFLLAENHAGLKVPDVSSFVQRRALLGGTKSVFGGLAMGYSTYNNPVRALGVMYLARKGSGFFVNPKNLDDVMKVMDYNTPNQQLYRSSVRLLDAMMSDKEVTKKEKVGFEEYKAWINDNKKDILKGNF